MKHVSSSSQEEAAAEEERTVAQVREGMISLQEMLDSGELQVPEKVEVETKLKALLEELKPLLPAEIDSTKAKLAELTAKVEGMPEGAEKESEQETLAELEQVIKELEDFAADLDKAPAADSSVQCKGRSLGWLLDEGILTDITVRLPDVRRCDTLWLSQVKAGETEHKAHRMVLASKSNFFYRRLVDAEVLPRYSLSPVLLHSSPQVVA